MTLLRQLKRIISSRKKIETHLPEAWKNLVQGENQSLLHAMVNETVKLCECKPTEDLVLDFLKRLKTPNEENETKKRHPHTRLVVTLDNGETISYRKASDTFVEVIEKLGIERVRDLERIENGVPLISTTKSDKHRQNKSGPYYIMTQTNTKRKQILLKKIADQLNVSLVVETVEKINR